MGYPAQLSPIWKTARTYKPGIWPKPFNTAVSTAIVGRVKPKKSQGNYSEVFAGKANGLKQGIYYLRISVDGKLTTKKMVQIDY